MTIMLLGGRRARPVHSASAHRRQLAGPVTGPASSDDDDDYDDGDSIESPASSTADSRGPDDPSWAAEPRIGVVGRGAGHNPRRQQVLAASLSNLGDDFGLPCEYADCDFVANPACTIILHIRCMHHPEHRGPFRCKWGACWGRPRAKPEFTSWPKLASHLAGHFDDGNVTQLICYGCANADGVPSLFMREQSHTKFCKRYQLPKHGPTINLGRANPLVSKAERAAASSAAPRRSTPMQLALAQRGQTRLRNDVVALLEMLQVAAQPGVPTRLTGHARAINTVTSTGNSLTDHRGGDRADDAEVDLDTDGVAVTLQGTTLRRRGLSRATYARQATSARPRRSSVTTPRARKAAPSLTIADDAAAGQVGGIDGPVLTLVSSEAGPVARERDVTLPPAPARAHAFLGTTAHDVRGLTPHPPRELVPVHDDYTWLPHDQLTLHDDALLHHSEWSPFPNAGDI
jgi:hypothetical protein